VFTCSYWGYWRSYIYLRIARLCGRKTVFHLLNAIDIFYSRAGRLQRFLIRHSLNTEDLYLVQSPGLRDWLEKLTRRDVVSLWNGIDFAAIPERADAKAEPDPKHLVGITVGALGQNKGTPDLLRAIQLLRARGLEVSWVFVGRGDLAKFRAMARAEGIFDSVVFTGTVSDAEKWRLLQQAHFFCLPSYAEGQPISVIEAMAVGLPVISTPVGSIPEVVTDENGILVSPGDVEGLCSAVARLTQEPGLRNSMGEASARLARERHDMRSVFAGIRKAYCGLVAAN
jgi:glycosyltransferase involved in cell wall biosynthesis